MFKCPSPPIPGVSQGSLQGETYRKNSFLKYVLRFVAPPSPSLASTKAPFRGGKIYIFEKQIIMCFYYYLWFVWKKLNMVLRWSRHGEIRDFEVHNSESRKFKHYSKKKNGHSQTPQSKLVHSSSRNRKDKSKLLISNCNNIGKWKLDIWHYEFRKPGISNTSKS